MLQTPREISGSWYTTKAEEASFLAALASDSPRVSVEQIGAGAVDSTPIYLVCIGNPGPVAPGGTDSILVIGMQHGEETATREAAIQFCRDLAYTTDPTLSAYLADHPVYVIPTANSDRIGDVVRNNKANVDLNRDHLSLSQPETRAMADAIRRIKPTIVIDVHENNDTGFNIELAHPTQVQASDQVLSTSLDLRNAVEASLVGLGYSTRTYTGTQTPELLRQSSALRHSLTLLSETDRTTFTTPQRIGFILSLLSAAVEYHRVNAASIIAAIAAGKAAKIEEGRAGAEPFVVSQTAVLDPPPLGYLLTQAQRDTAAYHLTSFGITATPSDGKYLVPMAQDAQPVIPFLFDEDSDFNIVSAERVYPARELIPGTSAESYGPVRVSGFDCEVTSVEVRLSGQLVPIWTRP